MGLGDEILAAGEALRTFQAGDGRRVAILDQHKQPRWHDLWEGLPYIARPEAVRQGERVLKIKNGPNCRPYLTYPFSVDGGFPYRRTWRAADNRGEILLTDQDLALGRQRRGAGRYLLIEPSLKTTQTVNKDWGFGRYQALADLLRTLHVGPWPVGLVRVVHDDPRPLLGTTELRGLTFRQVLGLLAESDGYVGPEGGLHHAAAALAVPAVVLFGGCIDAQVMGYPDQTTIADDGPGSPCLRHRPCPHCKRVWAELRPETVARAVKQLVRQPTPSLADA